MVSSAADGQILPSRRGRPGPWRGTSRRWPRGYSRPRGYDATPVRAIVEAAGVTKPTLYYHFGSKEGLAQALDPVPLDSSRRRCGQS